MNDYMGKIFDKRQSYLNERIYKKSNTDVQIPGLWEELFGSGLCHIITKHYPVTKAYFAKSTYITMLEWPDDCDKKIFALYQHMFYYGKGKWDKTVFDCFYVPWLSTAREYLRYIYPDFELEDLAVKLPGFRKRLIDLSLRTLIQEMKVWSEGKNADDVYKCFCRNVLKNEFYISQLYKKYPVMLRELIRCVRQTCDSVKECLEYLKEDRSEITKNLLGGCLFKKAVRIKDGLGDVHQGGRCVMEVTLDTGDKLVFKPHSLEHEIYYQEMTYVISKRCRLQTFIRPIVSGEKHGWEKQINALCCDTEEDVKKYYYRMGVHLFSAWLLCVKDLHYENIIAMGEYPVFVDTEVLLIPERKEESYLLFPSERWKSQSLLATCLLPIYVQGFGQDISGICGNGKMAHIKTPIVLNPGTDKMRMGYAMGDMPEGQNIPRILDSLVNPEMFAEEIENGFMDAFRGAMSIKSCLIRMMDGNVSLKGRFLYRYTQEYAMCLWSSYNPLFLTDGGMRHVFLMNIAEEKNDPVIRKINNLEIQQMLTGDVPYFAIDFRTTNLYSSKDEIVEKWFAETPKELLIRRINQLSEQDLKNEQIVLREAFDRNRSLNDMECNEKMERETIIYWILEKIANEKIILDNGNVTWVMKDYTAEGMLNQYEDVSNMNLYDGIAGIALFVGSCVKVLKDNRAKHLLMLLKRTLFAYTDQMARLNRMSRSGAFEGEASIVYAYHVLYKITGEKTYLTYCQKHAKILERYIETDEWYDVMDGNAGAILVLVNLYEETKEKWYLQVAIKAGMYLMKQHQNTKKGIAWRNKTSGHFLAGISHGGSGMFLAFARLYHWVESPMILEILHRIRRQEMTLYECDSMDWLDLRGKTPEVRKETAWCHGAGGILLSRLKSYPYVTGALKKDISDDICLAMKKVMNGHERKTFCLCHGNFGNRWIQDDYEVFSGKMTPKPLISELLIKRVKEHKLDVEESRRYGLMHGLSGIGYALLREQDPSLPNILSLEL